MERVKRVREMHEEMNYLEGRIKVLKDFYEAECITPKETDDRQRGTIVEQLKHMNAYLEILTERTREDTLTPIYNHMNELQK